GPERSEPTSATPSPTNVSTTTPIAGESAATSIHDPPRGRTAAAADPIPARNRTNRHPTVAIQVRRALSLGCPRTCTGPVSGPRATERSGETSELGSPAAVDHVSWSTYSLGTTTIEDGSLTCDPNCRQS